MFLMLLSCRSVTFLGPAAFFGSYLDNFLELFLTGALELTVFYFASLSYRKPCFDQPDLAHFPGGNNGLRLLSMQVSADYYRTHVRSLRK